MRGVNKVILVGNLGADPEERTTNSGTTVTTLNVATSESWTDKQSGEKVEKTEWHKIVMFGRLAEIAGEYCKKGRQVYIEGKLQTDKYTDKEGIERYATKIVAETMQLLGGNPDGERGQQRSSEPQTRGRGAEGNRGDTGQRGRQQQQAPADQGFFDDSEVPF